jgi:hypothetical protein
MILHARHVLQAGLCARGLRSWCRANAVDMRDMCGAGIETDLHPHLLDDPFVARVMLAARQEDSVNE